MTLEFSVTICLGYGDGGDVEVAVDVTDAEFALLVQCYQDMYEIDSYDGLEDLYKRIIEEAKGEDEACSIDVEDYDPDYDDASYIVSFPDEVIEAADSEEDDDE